MTQLIELNVHRNNIRDSKIVQSPLPSLNQDEVLVAIDKFGLTANNVSYAISGGSLGYWDYYPGEGDWGNVPVWGCANVIASNNDDIVVGERLWGFFPMASHTVLTPGRISAEQFTDQTDYRQALPRLYNTYRRTQAEPAIVQQYENERCLLVPLFTTSYVIYDYLLFNDLFGAEQVVIGSVSSKTGFGLAKMLHDDPQVNAKIVGITSTANQAFVDSLDCCDEVVLYGDEHQIDNTLATAYIDMSGNIGLTTTLHQHIGENIVDSAMVGASHWEAGGKAPQLPGAKPTFFFAPTHIGKRDAEWGAGATMKKGMEHSIKLTIELNKLMNIEWIQGADNLQKIWLELLDNQVAANRGLMVALHNNHG
ncbi:hypothetical protein SIN8267_00756 [Sinobacterium norvegicum]|uniref:DUF2855 domain-containing protein n=1 Tax=Sinobacterium norvegicum TaxID=1641715 RepID=A0ABN8EEC0_9GAMM|nr:DUF2855 family protein [Sinobacterium norvegicum]CAH0990662.1 hypothetical protein SIN8267_00756 [Sinobacterium norvegicum]